LSREAILAAGRI